MDINSSLSLLGSIGWYQLYVYLLSCLPVINAGIVMLSLVFLSATPEHRCFVPNCDTNPLNGLFIDTFISHSIPKASDSSQPYDSCNRFVQTSGQTLNTSDANGAQDCHRNWFTNSTEKCTEFVYDKSEFLSTVVTEFNKVCDKSWQPSICQSIFYLGVLSGAFVFGVIADRYGRQSVFKSAPILAFASAVLSSFAPNFLVFTVSSAVTAACIAGMYQTAFIIGIEFIGGQWRVWCGNIHSILFAVGAAILCLMAYYVRNWRDLQLIIAAPIALTLFYPWIFPESIRWQISNGQTSKAIKTIRRAAKWNSVYIPEEYLYTNEDCFNGCTSDTKQEDRHYGPLDLLRHRILSVWTYNLFFIWFTTSLVYYGLSFQAQNIGSNIYLTFGFLALAEIPAIVLATIAMQRFGRKIVLCLLLTTGGISCIIPAFLPEAYGSYITVCAVFGKSNIAAAFSLIYVYSVEIFPTVLRSSGLGMCSMSSRIGGILAPQLIGLSVFGKSFPLLIAGLVSVLAGLLVVNLPETHNRQLPETLDDVQALKDGNKAFKLESKHSLDPLEDEDERVKLLNGYES